MWGYLNGDWLCGDGPARRGMRLADPSRGREKEGEGARGAAMPTVALPRCSSSSPNSCSPAQPPNDCGALHVDRVALHVIRTDAKNRRECVLAMCVRVCHLINQVSQIVPSHGIPEPITSRHGVVLVDGSSVACSRVFFCLSPATR